MKRAHQRVVRRIRQSLHTIPLEVWQLILALLGDNPHSMLCMLATCHQAIDWMRPVLQQWLIQLRKREHPLLESRMTHYLKRHTPMIEVTDFVHVVSVNGSDQALRALVYVAYFTNEEERLLYCDGGDECYVKCVHYNTVDRFRAVNEPWFVSQWIDKRIEPLTDSMSDMTLRALSQRHNLYRHMDLQVPLLERQKAVSLLIHQSRNVNTLLEKFTKYLV